MVFHGSRLVFHGFLSVFVVPDLFSWFLVCFHGSRLVLNGSRLIFLENVPAQTVSWLKIHSRSTARRAAQDLVTIITTMTTITTITKKTTITTVTTMATIATKTRETVIQNQIQIESADYNHYKDQTKSNSLDGVVHITGGSSQDMTPL